MSLMIDSETPCSPFSPYNQRGYTVFTQENYTRFVIDLALLGNMQNVALYAGLLLDSTHGLLE